MPLTFDSFVGLLNGATQVILTGPPAALTVRAIRELRFDNLDTAPVTIRLIVNNGVSDFEIDSVVGLAVGSKWKPIQGDDVMFLNSAQKLIAVLDAVVTANQPSYKGSFLDRS